MGGRRRARGRCAQIAHLGRRALQGLCEGSLTLRQVVGLTEQEMDAIAETAAELHRRGVIAQASSLYGLLAAHDPLRPGYWRGLAQTNAALGQDVTAVAALEVAAMLEDRRPVDVEQEASCLERIGQTSLAGELRQAMFAAPGGKGAKGSFSNVGHGVDFATGG